jgi:hypothetical protein
MELYKNRHFFCFHFVTILFNIFPIIFTELFHIVTEYYHVTRFFFSGGSGKGDWKSIK